MGSLSILSVGGGDITVTFDKNNPTETIRAKRIIKDMLRRGYALLVEIDGAYQRAIDFDENINSYIIADFDPEGDNYGKTEEKEESAGAEKKELAKTRNKKRFKSLPIESSTAVAVARSAGG